MIVNAAHAYIHLHQCNTLDPDLFSVCMYNIAVDVPLAARLNAIQLKHHSSALQDESLIRERSWEQLSGGCSN